MKPMRLIAVTAMLAGATACSSEQVRSAEDAARDVEALNAILAEHVAAVNSGDTAANLAGRRIGRAAEVSDVDGAEEYRRHGRAGARVVRPPWRGER